MALAAALAAIEENFRFLCIEVRRQVSDMRVILHARKPDLEQRLFSRDDYIDNLKSIIENKCYALLVDEELDKPTVNRLRATITATANLERIADFAVNVIGQLQYLTDQAVLNRFDPDPICDEILDAIERTPKALLETDITVALKLCRAEVTVDELFVEAFKRILDGMRGSKSPEQLVTVLFIFRYLERMGDAILNVGEAAIFAAAGEKLKISQYQALNETLSEVDLSVADIDYRGIWETRSGARIGALRTRREAPNAPNAPRWIIFKEGQRQKVLEEKEALERWQAIMPGLVPAIHGFHEHGDSASLLLEYVTGETLQRSILQADVARLRKAYRLAVETIAHVWTSTMESTPRKPRFVRQLRKRLKDVLVVHPEFNRPRQHIGGLELPSLGELLDRMEPLDDTFESPFSVLTHGDFNTDNVIVDADANVVHFIDLHRSKQFDYVQDVSVFIVSNFRLPIEDPTSRGRLDAVAREFFQFAKAFAERHGDTTFEARLALGLARSFLTSTRFDLETFSREMYLRSLYVMERLDEHRRSNRPWSEFRLDPVILTH
jgi:phosphate uptake regulator/aminoglycoside phosphotransferase